MFKTKQRLPAKILLPKIPKIAYICSPRFGDTLISLVLVNNLLRAGYWVDVYGNYAYALAAWFPEMKIYPALSLEEAEKLSDYSLILHMYPSELSKKLQELPHHNSYVLAAWPFYKRKELMVDIQLEICAELFGLQNLERANGFKPLADLVKRKFPNRIVIHPTSAYAIKNWPLKKFFKLAKALMARGYEVNFVVGPDDKKYADEIIANGFTLASFGSLSELAAFLYESGYFIGNDAGCGHLASNLGVPTLTIMMRRGVARQWSPSFSRGEIVLAPVWVNPRPLRERIWRYFVTVGMVCRAFEKIMNNE